MPDKIVYYQHDEYPWYLARLDVLEGFEKFDLDTKEWVEDGELFYRVYEDDDFHKITEEEANQVISKIPDGLAELSDEETGNKLEEIFYEKDDEFED